MKKSITLLVFILLFVSCKKEDKATTYQIINDLTPVSSSTEFLDGSIYDIVVFHYLNSDIIKQDNIDKVSPGGGKSGLIKVPANSEKIKISFKFLPPESSSYDLDFNYRRFVVAYTIIEIEKNNIVTLTDDTMIRSYANSKLGDSLLETKGIVSK